MTGTDYFEGYGEQVSQSSWWPSDSVWVSSGFNVGYWSTSCEEWFQRRLDALTKSERSISNIKRWRKMVKMYSQTNDIAQLNESQSKDFLASILHVSDYYCSNFQVH